MEPIRRAERLVRAIDEAAVAVRGLPLLNQDKVWNRMRHVGLDELTQFDWTLVGEADALSGDLGRTPALDEIDVTAHETRLRTIREVIAERRRYLEILA
jgi:hypothetical protein